MRSCALATSQLRLKKRDHSINRLSCRKQAAVFLQQVLFNHRHVSTIGVIAFLYSFPTEEMPSLKVLSSCGFAIVLSCSLLIAVSNAVPFKSLQPRKEVDANLVCSNLHGVPNPQPWPANVPPRSSYHTTLDLCAKNQDLANVGCLCDSPYDHVECRPELGDPVLRAEFLHFCLANCLCRHGNDNDPVAGAVTLGRPPALRPYAGPNPFAGVEASRLPGSWLGDGSRFRERPPAGQA